MKKIILLISCLIVLSACKNTTESDPNAKSLDIILSPTHVSEYDSSDGAINVTVSGGTSPYQYLWSNGAVTEDINQLAAGEYIINVTDANNQTAVDSIIITQPRLFFQLTTEDGDSEPIWSPDGQTIAYTSYRNGQDNIWLVSSGGGIERKLTFNGGKRATWSPDGQQIAFSRQTGNRWDIWTITLNDCTETRIISGTVAGERPCWSPDGTKILVEYDGDIWIIFIDGSTPIRLTTYSGWDITANWSPDGSTVSFVSDRSGFFELYTIPENGGTPTQITNFQSDVLYPTWSPDGTHFVFSRFLDPIYNIFTLPVAGGNAVELINNSDYDSYPSWSPDGKKVVFSSHGGNSGLWIVSVD